MSVIFWRPWVTSGACRDAGDDCMFDAGLEDLAVKHGGREPSQKWIDSMLQKQKEGAGDSDEMRMRAKVERATYKSEIDVKCGS